jgi:plastocyanin
MRSNIRLFIPLVTVLAFCVISSNPRSALTKSRAPLRSAEILRPSPTEERANDPLCRAKTAAQQIAAPALFVAPRGAFDSGPSALSRGSNIGGAKMFALSPVERIMTIEAVPEAGAPLILGLPEEDLATKIIASLRPAGQTVTVHVGGSDGASFEPSEVNINVGDTVQWVWDAPNHTVTGGASCVSNGQFNSSGPTFSRTFNTPGNYSYYCSVHCANFGMAGSVNVQGSAATFTISGKVTNGSTALNGVTVNLSGAASASTTTNASGEYSFANLAAGNYTVTPAHANYTFTPASRSYTGLSANQTNQDFAATLKTYTISGVVKVGTAALAGVTMTLASPTPAGFTPRTLQTNSTGNYTFTNVPAGRNYTLTPAKSGFTFNPVNRSFTNLSANQTNQNFAATASSFTISGIVKLGTSGLAGVTMTLTSPTPAGFPARTVTTGSAGGFSFASVPGGRNYKLTPSKVNYTFQNTSNTSQSFRSYTNLSASQTNQNFAATLKKYTISGVVKIGTTALAGVTMRLVSTTAGFTPRTVLTGSAGGYSLANVPGGRSYTLTPSKTNYTFKNTSNTSQSFRSYPNLSADQTNQNFAATLNKYSISGRVKLGNSDTGIAAVTMTLTSPTPAGFPARTLQTNSNGGYSFTNVPAGRNYTLKPTKSGFTFNPVSRSYNNLSADQIGSATSFSGTSTGSAPDNIQFSESSYMAREGDSRFDVTVIRSGDLSAPASIDYSVDDGTASERSDYSTTLGTLRFAAGETSRSFTIFLTDDAYTEGDETVNLTLGNASGAAEKGNRNTASLTITDNDFAAASINPVDDPAFLVRQHYVDFLAREPSPEELFNLVNILNRCVGGDSTCDRTQVSAGFLRSEEFRQRGYFVYRLYKASLGRPPSYREFIRDLRQVEGASSDELAASQEAFLDQWMERAEFKDKYDALSDKEYVESLSRTAGMSFEANEGLLGKLESASKTRSQALREMILSAELSRKLDESASVTLLYFGYLRRDPDAEEASRQGGQPFINSVEYRSRFGQP